MPDRPALTGTLGSDPSGPGRAEPDERALSRSKRSLRRQALVTASVAAALSLALGYYQLLRGGGLHAILEYDDGIYFGSAVRLAQGSLPYRDYVFVHPPGIAVLLAPLGFLSRLIGTRAAFELARLGSPVIEAAGVFCAGWLVRYRRGATLVACVVMTVLADAVATERTVLLEPYCALGCLLGLLVLFEGDRITESRRRLIWSGALFAVAGSVEVFTAFPLLAVLAILAFSGHKRSGDKPSGYKHRLVPFALGGACAFAVICGPFIAVAPREFVRDVVAGQISRTQVVLPSIWARLLHLFGLPEVISHSGPLRVLAVLLVLAAMVGLVSTAAARAVRTRHVSSLDVCVTGSAVSAGFFLMQPPAFYYHYAAFFAPFLALILGLAAAGVGPRLAAVLGTCLLFAGTVHAVRYIQVHTVAPPARSATIEALLPSNACVFSDDPAYLLLANRFGPSSCHPVLDSFGDSFVREGGTVRPTPASDQFWMDQFSRMEYLDLTQGFHLYAIPWDESLDRYVTSHFQRISDDPILYTARTAAASPASG